MASAEYVGVTMSRSRKRVKVGITSFGFIAVVVGAFYLGSQQNASPIAHAPQSAVTRDTLANVSKGADDANAPVSPARARDTQGSEEPAAIVARGEQVIHASDAADAATYADVSRLLAGNADDIAVTAFENALDAAKVAFAKGDMTSARWQQLVALCVASSLRVEMYRGTLSSNDPPSRATVANSAVGCDKTVSTTLGVNAL